MKRIFRLRLFGLLIALLAMSLATLGAAQPAPGTLLEATPAGIYETDDIQQLAAPFFVQHGVPPLAAAVETFDLRYTTTDFDGSSLEVSAQLFIPVLGESTTRPMFTVGSGTTGIADKCAPSRENELEHPLGHYRANMLTYASRGLITVFPDYLGFESPNRTQAYFNALGEARVLLDASRAALAFFEQYESLVQPSGAVFTGGYSQGGHAAFAAADLRPSYAPDIDLRGAIGYGATTNVETLLKEGPYYAPYIVESYRNTYGEDIFDPAQILNERWLATLTEDVGRMCVDEAQAYYPFDVERIYTPDFAAALTSGALAETLPDIHRVLEENNTGLSGHGLPALIIQGEDDIIVLNESQERFAGLLCERGSDTLYLRYPGVRHRSTRQVGFEETIAWIDTINRGESAPSSCAPTN